MSATISPARTPHATDSTNTTDTVAAARSRSGVGSIWKATGVSGVVAAIAVTVVAAVAREAGAALDVDGERIPLLGFAQLTLVGALIGGVLATVLHKRARHPRRTFVATTAVLTALSVVPDFTMSIEAASSVVLAGTHLLAAAIIVPALAARTAR